MTSITKVAIYPPIGIARIGNSAEYYYAPELPGNPPEVEDGYKDDDGKIKKQVVRFRIYGLDDNDHVVQELTADDAEINWRVHVANRKSAWYQFKNALDLGALAIPGEFRNQSIQGGERQKLIIDPEMRSIAGRNTSGEEYQLNDGEFWNKKVPLGEIRTDDQGRLIFFGGNGDSASYDGSPATTFANNDRWHDDVCDGPIRATVNYQGKTLEAEPAIVVVAPPNYGQGLYGVVTMYDVVLDLFIREQWVAGIEQPNFWTHIYPIFERLTRTQWVNSGFFFLFGYNSPSDLTDHELLTKLGNPGAEAREDRMKLFSWFRNPESGEHQPAQIPPFYGDAFSEFPTAPNVDLALTITQYQWLQQWAEGDFTNDRPSECKSFADLTPQQQTEALNIAPLEECLGGPFHPGIEITWILRVLMSWEKPFRLKILPEGTPPQDDFGAWLAPEIAIAEQGPLDGYGAGSVTRWLGVPWQTDEASCLSGYNPSTYLPLPSFWAARVPNQVLSEDSFKRLTDGTLNTPQRLKHFDYRQDWLRDFGSQYQPKINKMIKEWHELGIVAEHEALGNEAEPYLPILLANVLQPILRNVLLRTKAKIFRLCTTFNFFKDFFGQQYPYLGSTPISAQDPSLALVSAPALTAEFVLLPFASVQSVGLCGRINPHPLD